ncbi:MAG: hypothetical protein MUC96_16790 [Myxococcaceae bacterium]|jgi:hypothetical protein|nr:hypothetical protein [Myxococcaceae bacterium]
MTRRLVVWCEDDGHWNACRGLAQTLTSAEGPDWVREDPDQFANLVGQWERLSDKPEAPGFGPLSRFGQGLPNSVFRRVLIGLALRNAPELVVLAMDDDHHPTRRTDLDRAAAADWPFRVVRMMPVPEIEAWQIALSDVDDSDVAVLLRFSPRREPHRLTSTVRGDPRDAKEVAQRLGLDEWELEDWADIPADMIRDTATACPEVGLRLFLDDLRRHLIKPLSTGPTS